MWTPKRPEQAKMHSSRRPQGPSTVIYCLKGQVQLHHRKKSRRSTVQTCSSATLERPATQSTSPSQNGYVRPPSAGSNGLSNGHTRTSPRGVCITTQDLLKEFSTSNGRHLAVNHLTTRFEPDKMVALLGPSGSGKTTLLRMIAGLESTSSGKIMFDDKDATHLSVQDRGVGFVFQSYALFKHMTLAENIAFGPRTRKLDMDVDARVEQLLEMVKLPGQGHRYPMQLSGGQRQRIALARALAVNPRLLLLDEPFGALDPMTRTELRRDMKAILNEVGITSILVTHDQEEAFDIADHVAVFNRGKIQQLGTPEEIKESPVNPFVAWFTDLNINTLPAACSFVRRMGLKSDKPLVMVKASAVQLYTGPSEAEAVQQGYVPAVIRDIMDTGLQARCFLMFEDGAEIEMHMDGRLHQRAMEVELQQKVFVRVDPENFTAYSPSDISTQPVIQP